MCVCVRERERESRERERERGGEDNKLQLFSHISDLLLHSSMIMSIQYLLNQPLDPTLVDNTPRLLEVLNRSQHLPKLLNKRDDRGYTLLHIAAERNQPESLKCLLIKEGLAINAINFVRSYEVGGESSPGMKLLKLTPLCSES